MCEAKRSDVRFRDRRTDELIEELRELRRKNKKIFDRWRAEGILRPEDRKDRV